MKPWLKEILSDSLDVYTFQDLFPGEEPTPCVALLAAVMLRAVREGDICATAVSLNQAARAIPETEACQFERLLKQNVGTNVFVSDKTEINESIVPVIRDGECFFWNRHFRMLREIREKLKILRQGQSLAETTAGDTIRKSRISLNENQQLAVHLAMHSPLLVLSGGPGTGKTTVIAEIMRSLLKAGIEVSQILLAAPTGKAAMRIEASLSAAGLEVAFRAKTIHRMLEFSRRGFRRNKDNHLVENVLIIDEMSMVNLELLHAVFAALRENSRVILVGDRHQLPPVESGAVLPRLTPDGSPCYSSALLKKIGIEAAQCENNPLADTWVELTETKRFDGKIGRAAANALAGQWDESLVIEKKIDEIQMGEQGLFRIVTDKEGLSKVASSFVTSQYGSQWMHGQSGNMDTELPSRFSVYNSARVLTPLRNGMAGSIALNRIITQSLFPDMVGKNCFHGLPIIISHNDYSVNLFNGDEGICLQNDGELYAWFRDGNSFRAVSPMRLPAFQPGFVQTIHSAQGSEFDTILMLHPGGTAAEKLMQREILYTALTRAKRSAWLAGDVSILEKAVRERRLKSLPFVLWQV